MRIVGTHIPEIGVTAMTLPFQKFLSQSGLLSHEDVIASLQNWQAEGKRTVLVTLIGVDGGAPRQAGAQMAVADDGSYAGYLSGGCLEQAVVLEALAVLQSGQNAIVRYGKGSPYFDVKLPCGSGLDLYFDQNVSPDCVADILARRARRQPCVFRTELSTGVSTVADTDTTGVVEQSVRQNDVFHRVYPIGLRLVLLGNGPGLTGLAVLAAATGIDLQISTIDDATRAELEASGLAHALAHSLAGEANSENLVQLDSATAAVLFFHAHDQEPDLLAAILKSRSFYIGAIGNHAVHRDRLAILAARGFSAGDLERIRAPVGSIAGAKSKATLAIGVLAELMGQAKALNLVA